MAALSIMFLSSNSSCHWYCMDLLYVSCLVKWLLLLNLLWPDGPQSFLYAKLTNYAYDMLIKHTRRRRWTCFPFDMRTGWVRHAGFDAMHACHAWLPCMREVVGQQNIFRQLFTILPTTPCWHGTTNPYCTVLYLRANMHGHIFAAELQNKKISVACLLGVVRSRQFSAR